ncbi:MAG: molybdopterin-dependent oxidoreductase [Dehalococcoidales bacterium]|nr:molybdopterin-dependent oxidoreductase [Dehalococcoidales bacterium]
MKKPAIVAISLPGLLSLVLVGMVSCRVNNINETDNLTSVEVKEYQGEKLSSVLAFRENAISGPQYVDLESYQLKITGLIENPRDYTYDEVINQNQHYQKVVTLNCVEGWSATILWEGLLVNDLIKKSNPLPDAKIVIFHAYDGYTTSLPLDYIVNNNILIAYKMNEVTMPPQRGFPFELVAESKWGYKWIKWITEIELSDDTGYHGYWESRGYSNSANLSEDF